MLDLANPYKAYQFQQNQNNQVEFLSSQQQISALYKRFIELVDNSIDLLDDLNKSSEKITNLNKAIKICLYLQDILVDEGDIELYQMYNDLYEFVIDRLRKSLTENNQQYLTEAKQQIESLSDIWQNMSKF